MADKAKKGPTRGEMLEKRYPGLKFYPDGTPSRKTAARSGNSFSDSAYRELDEMYGDPDKRGGKKAAEPDANKAGDGPPENKALDDFTNERLEKAIEAADLKIPEEGTGATGNVVKRDLVKTLEDAGKDAAFVLENTQAED